MARYFEYHYKDRGIRGMAPSIPLASGIAMHDGLATLVQSGSLNAAVGKVASNYGDDWESNLRSEQVRLAEGLVRIWHDLVWPQVQEGYVVESSEHFFESTLGQHNLIVKPDLVLRDKRSGAVTVVDFKSVSNPSPDWAIRTANSLQFMLMQWVLSKSFGDQLNFVLHGLVKGSHKGKWNPKTRKEEGPKFQQSPICYGFCQAGNPPLSEDQWEAEEWYTTRNGFQRKLDSSYERRSTGEYPGGVEAWIQKLKEDGLLGKFLVITEPFSFSQEQVEQALRSVEGHEDEWQRRLDLLALDFSWEQVDKLVPRSYACHNFDGSTCQYKPICFHESDHWMDPLASGRYQLRSSIKTAGTVEKT